MFRLFMAALLVVLVATPADACFRKRAVVQTAQPAKMLHGWHPGPGGGGGGGGGGGWHRPGGWPGGGGYHHGPGNVGGVLGGIIIGNAISNFLFPPRQVVVEQPVIVQREVPEMTPQQFNAYCANKYKSWNAMTQTYTGYDGQQYACQ